MHAVNWFEIPVSNLERAMRFYEHVLGVKLRREEFGGIDSAVFPHAEPSGVGGSLVRDDRRKPGGDGCILYLHAPELEASVTRLREVGGEMIMPVTDIGPPGFIALVRDSEGNTVGLHRPR